MNAAEMLLLVTLLPSVQPRHVGDPHGISLERAAKEMNHALAGCTSTDRVPRKIELKCESIINRVDWKRSGIGSKGRMLIEPEDVPIDREIALNHQFPTWVAYALCYAAQDARIQRPQIVTFLGLIEPAQDRSEWRTLQRLINARESSAQDTHKYPHGFLPFLWRSRFLIGDDWVASKAWPWRRDPSGHLHLEPIYWQGKVTTSPGPLSHTMYSFRQEFRKMFASELRTVP